MIDLQKCRDEIDEIDGQLVQLIKDRMIVSGKVAEYKRSTGKKVFDKEREDAILDKLGAKAENEFQKQCLKELFTQIMSMSRKLQYRSLSNDIVKFGFDTVKTLEVSGKTCAAGTDLPDIVIRDYDKMLINRVNDPQEMIKMLLSQQVQYAILPMDEQVLDQLAKYDIYIMREHVVKSTTEKRFFLIGTKKVVIAGGSKISIWFDITPDSESLYRMFSYFSFNKLKITKLESQKEENVCRYFVDFEGNLDSSEVQNALYGIQEEAINMKVLGNYNVK